MPRIALLFLAAILGMACPPAFAAKADKAQVDVATEATAAGVPDGLTFRVRVAAAKPAEPVAIAWRHGGEGLGGEVVRGTLAPKVEIGEWTPLAPLKSLVTGKFPGRLFLTLTAGAVAKPGAKRSERPAPLAGVEFEIEFAFGGKVVKTVKESGPDGGTAGLLVPAYRLTGGVKPDDPAFLADLVGISEYASRRAETLEKLPWAGQPVPRKYMIVTDVGGYGEGGGYGVRHTNKAIVEAECRSLRQLGVNSLRSAPEFLRIMAAKGEGYAKDLGRGADIAVMGYPVEAYREGRKNDPEAGCPFGGKVAERTEAGVKAALDNMLAAGVPEVWGLTVDEIGAVFDRTAEGKAHPATCPRCGEAFRAYLKGQGLMPADFGAKDWAEVRPADLSAKAGAAAIPDKGTALAAYQTRMFVNYASARLFTPLRDALARANDAKRKALAAGDKDSAVARQPWAYSYALRGNTFLMKGHSLDFFDFYRHADNAFCYEMSNRDPRVPQWDGYLCDVGRVVSAAQGLALGVYVKPHRGAPVQRALTAAARGARMIYWYTYGPDYKKGDSFSERPEALALVSKAARILGKSEDVLYGATWAAPAEVAIVKPRTSEIWMALTGDPAKMAAWEDAKWTWTALAHAHIPVDAIDEVLLAQADLARYKVLYLCGPNVTRAAAEKVARWVEAGGTLVTSAGGAALDEANQPLAGIEKALGLKSRTAPEMYYRISLYGATALEPYDDARSVITPAPDAARVSGQGAFAAAFKPVVGREVLRPGAGAAVLAKFADGGAAVTCNPCGKGKAYVLGYFAGLEYSAGVRVEAYDMSKDFAAAIRAGLAAPALDRVRPAVETSAAAVEGVLVKNPASGRQAVVLMNWAYRVAGAKAAGKAARAVTELVSCKDLKVTVRGAGAAAKATSAWLDKPLAAERSGDALIVTLPQLDEGDVVLLE